MGPKLMQKHKHGKVGEDKNQSDSLMTLVFVDV